MRLFGDESPAKIKGRIKKKNGWFHSFSSVVLVTHLHSNNAACDGLVEPDWAA